MREDYEDLRKKQGQSYKNGNAAIPYNHLVNILKEDVIHKYQASWNGYKYAKQIKQEANQHYHQAI